MPAGGPTVLAGSVELFIVTLSDAFGNPVAPGDTATLFQVAVRETSGVEANDWQEELLGGSDPYSTSASMRSAGTAEVSFAANVSGVYEVRPAFSIWDAAVLIQVTRCSLAGSVRLCLC